MKFKSTWILIALFLALGAYMVFVEEPAHQARQEAGEKEGLVFPDLEVEAVTALSLESRRGAVRVLRGEGNRWAVTEPVEDRADDGKVRTLLSSLKNLKAQREVAGPDADVTAFGLQEPEVVVRVGEGEALSIGALNPAGDSRYLRLGDGPVRIVDQSAVSGFLVEPDDLRSKNVLDAFPWESLATVEIRPAEGEPLRLAKHEGAWRIEAPIAAEADPEEAKKVAEKLRWTRIEGFLDPEPEDAAEKLASGTTVVLTAEGGEPITVRLAAADGTTWAESSGRSGIFTLGTDVLEAFRVSAETLRRKKPLLVEAWKLDRVAFRRGDEETVYEKTDNLWNRGGRRVEGEEFTVLSDVLQLLETGAADRVIDGAAPAEYGFDPPELVLEVRDTDGTGQSVLLARTEDGVYARGANGGPVYRMPSEYLEKIDALLRVAAGGVDMEPPGEEEAKTAE